MFFPAIPSSKASLHVESYCAAAKSHGTFLYTENHSLGEWFKRGCCR